MKTAAMGGGEHRSGDGFFEPVTTAQLIRLGLTAPPTQMAERHRISGPVPCIQFVQAEEVGAAVAGDGAGRWPRSNERADVAVIGTRMDGFEIKPDRDTLRRLPRQIEAYNRLFDRCTVVLAERHLDAAHSIAPEWWGVAMILADRAPLSFRLVRPATTNRGVDPETLVRLLWREEARTVLSAYCTESPRQPGVHVAATAQPA